MNIAGYLIAHRDYCLPDDLGIGIQGSRKVANSAKNCIENSEWLRFLAALRALAQIVGGCSQESSGEAGKVNISQSTYEMIKDALNFKFESRGKIEAKHKGVIEMYFVERA